MSDSLTGLRYIRMRWTGAAAQSGALYFSKTGSIRKLEDDILPDLSEKTSEAIRKQQRKRWERKHGEHEK